VSTLRSRPSSFWITGDHNDLSRSPLLALESEIKKIALHEHHNIPQPQNYQDQRDETGGVSFPPGRQNKRHHASFSWSQIIRDRVEIRGIASSIIHKILIFSPLPKQYWCTSTGNITGFNPWSPHAGSSLGRSRVCFCELVEGFLEWVVPWWRWKLLGDDERRPC